MRDHPRGRVRDGRADRRSLPERYPYAYAADSSRRRRMSRNVLGLLVVLTLVGCTTAAHTNTVSAQSIALQPGDVSGLGKCAGTGLGPESVVGSGYVSGAPYYFAFWQKKVVDSFFIAYDMPSAVAEGATRRVNQRMNW